MRKLEIYKEDWEFVIEHVNEFDHAVKSYFATEEGLKEGLEAYIPLMNEYEIKASSEVWGLVINLLNSISVSKSINERE
ncbi:hypothetical protein HOO54_01120 [Bacillus sp. WMMC1349]|nr:hypothetical protein [Bacillus sp. WMMC1349]NPC90840.1 hypothetical protein [Bacillus sp. WMMC1349]NPC90896.1 hypothetical protein [Bacillus sp. WMMC1349]NPC90905.1 hypothetical protein [Bacillus sp. WMMC1349]